MVDGVRGLLPIWGLTTAFMLPMGLVAESQNPPLNLETARRVLASDRPVGTLGSISLVGLEFSRELEIGAGMRVISVTTSLNGGLAAFRKDGSLITTTSTGPITWLQLFDLNEDGVSEVVTEEVEGKGSGILIKSFAIYVVSATTVKKVWRQESYVSRTPWTPAESKPSVDETRSFLRFDSSGAGRKARMTYLTRASSGRKPVERVFEIEGESIQERSR